MRWLIPRLPDFQQKYPHITVHLAERMEPFVLAGSGFDAAIHFDHPAWAGMHMYHLLNEVLVPVCHPKLITGRTGEAVLECLPLLHRRQNPNAWERYAQETGTPLGNPAIGARYDLHSMLIEAALAGLGVALVPRFYVEAELSAGRLVAPWPERTSISKTFSLVLPQSIELSSGPMRLFVQWVQGEAKIAGAAMS